ncbi:hypothetical protein J4456_03970 [Candidatus Pacearchaeota archaeon]|nr:hypothetical protein [Candidatus Pacearchaeota archaeon]
MNEIKQLDDFFESTNSIKNEKFVLFEIQGRGYIRVSKLQEVYHKDIVNRFAAELQGTELTYSIQGGGRINFKRGCENITLLFYDYSIKYGKFDKQLLEKTLKELNEDIKFIIH